MRKALPNCFRSTLIAAVLLMLSFGSKASHIVGADLNYTWISGNTYKITVMLYGDCGAASSGSFRTLQISSPQVCIYNGTTLVTSLLLPIQAPICGSEITPVCPDSLTRTQCTNTSYATPGIKRFVYSINYTFPTTSHLWRLVYTSNNGSAVQALACGFTGNSSPSGAGRAAAITNLAGAGGTLMQLVDTLDNFYHPNSSAVLTVVPTPFFCLNTTNCYNPGAVDPDGDSLRFNLTAAGNGTGACGTVGGDCTYTGTAWGTTPVSATTPLRCTAGSFAFDPATGQICFYPNFLQRSVVVYNTREYRNDTFMGSSQREMTFLVLTCTNVAPTGGATTVGGVITKDDTFHYHICGDAGAFSISMDPTEPSPTNTITVTATGIAGTGLSFVVTGNGTTTPHVVISGNASTMTPGLITFFLTFRDNNCPLTGVTTSAYSINIYPVPTIHHTIITPVGCLNNAVVRVEPGGTGKPWTVKTVDSSLFGTAPLDTINTHVDSLNFFETLAPGRYVFYITTAVSTECGLNDTVRIDTPGKMRPYVTFTNPTYCGGRNGTITVHGLYPGTLDTVLIKFNGAWQTAVIATAASDSTIVLTTLDAGTYDSLIVRYGYCTSKPIGPWTLVNPAFTWRALEYQNPSKCGFCDGWIKLYGLHPDQQDTISYTFNSTATSTGYFIGADSMVYLSGLCEGNYANFVARTASVCVTSPLAGANLQAPPIGARFDSLVHLGCHGDTLFLTNHSFPASDLTYTWDFGDGLTDTVANPVHVYTNTANTTYTVVLHATNSRCVDSAKITRTYNNYVNADFAITPFTNYICQGTPDTITNNSTGTNLTYFWDYGDGTTSTTASPVHNHTYTNTGTYTTTLIAANFLPCYDTVSYSFTVDSISDIRIAVTDSVFCTGQGATFTALYAHIGDTGNVWTFSDGEVMNNVNPIMHSFDGGMDYTVSVTAKYRSCPETTATRSIHVVDFPHFNLGGDTAICPGSSSVTLHAQGGLAPGARWLWNTGETSSSITVGTPGYYTATVTVNGCSTSDTVWVQNDCYMSIPNVFTPNGDGVNDFFFPRQWLSKGVTKFKMNIYNRWGQLIYETTNLDGLGWDGALNNTPQPGGVYVYIIDATFKDGQVEHHQGNVTLLR